MLPEQLEIKVPTLGESITEATVARWLKKVGDLVSVDEALVELETDKITLEVSSPAAGILESIFMNKGGVVKVGSIIGVIRKNNPNETDTEIFPLPTPFAEIEETPAVDQEQSLEKIESVSEPFHAEYHLHHHVANRTFSPSVQKLLADHNLDPSTIESSGKGERLTKGDILDYLDNPRPQPIIEQSYSNSESETLDWMLDKERLEKRAPMSRLRQRVAERLKQAQNTAAILTTFNEVDMSAINNLRARYKDAFEKKYGIKLGFMSFFVKACTQALKEIPMMNSQIEGDEIVHKNYYDIGIAVSTTQGLVVPVLRDADHLDFAIIEKEVAALGAKAKENKLSIEDLSGGTFTISNGGIFGSLLSTPILNPPQSGILGMHKIQDRPVVIDGKIEIRPMMYLALSYDHRLIDGREAVTFLVKIKESIENPGRFLLEL
jgi:2-oxoglutarate dehydrogenase E2 component (dihydrolipoamide succinyltransferase)